MWHPPHLSKLKKRQQYSTKLTGFQKSNEKEVIKIEWGEATPTPVHFILIPMACLPLEICTAVNFHKNFQRFLTLLGDTFTHTPTKKMDTKKQSNWYYELFSHILFFKYSFSYFISFGHIFTYFFIFWHAFTTFAIYSQFLSNFFTFWYTFWYFLTF